MSDFRIHQLACPDGNGWSWQKLFVEPETKLGRLWVHHAGLDPGHSPHPCHSHEDEELLLMLAGRAEILAGSTGCNAQSGGVVYHPAGSSHTLRSSSTQHCHYLVLRWPGREEHLAARDGHGPPDTRHCSAPGLNSTGLGQGRFELCNSVFLHWSRLAAGQGYPAHRDSHDLALVVIKGTVEVLGTRLRAPGLAYVRAGTPHGLTSLGPAGATYIALEFR